MIKPVTAGENTILITNNLFVQTECPQFPSDRSTPPPQVDLPSLPVPMQFSITDPISDLRSYYEMTFLKVSLQSPLHFLRPLPCTLPRQLRSKAFPPPKQLFLLFGLERHLLSSQCDFKNILQSSPHDLHC